MKALTVIITTAMLLGVTSDCGLFGQTPNIVDFVDNPSDIFLVKGVILEQYWGDFPYRHGIPGTPPKKSPLPRKSHTGKNKGVCIWVN